MTGEKTGFMEAALKAVHLAGETILENLGTVSEKDISLKQSFDFVTRVDKESENIIIKTIRQSFPDHHFLGEESLKESAGGYRWIIDPIDGTTNYIHRYPVFSVSIALEYEDEMILGVVLDPTRNELFTAEKGQGTFLNGKPVKASGVSDIGKALITTGFPFRKKNIIDDYLTLFRTVFLRGSDLRRTGSAALDLAYVASGRCEAFFEIGLSPWDIAAGGLLVSEAGGIITDFEGGKNYLSSGDIVAGNEAIHREILKETRNVFHKIEKNNRH
jgi:myo-inositol-1(or 4)-monophosphatase